MLSNYRWIRVEREQRYDIFSQARSELGHQHVPNPALITLADVSGSVPSSPMVPRPYPVLSPHFLASKALHRPSAQS